MTKKKPAFQKRLNHIRVTVWPNVTEKTGDVWYSTEVKRRYQDGKDWHDSYSLNGVADICLAIEALSQARDFIRNQEPCAEANTLDTDSDE